MIPNNQARTLAGQLSNAFQVFAGLVVAAFLMTTLAYGVGKVWLRPELQRMARAEQDEAAAFAAMLDQDAGLRGYLITHDKRFLEVMARGAARLPSVNRSLMANAGSAPEVAAAMIATRVAEDRWSERARKFAADPDHDAAIPTMLEANLLFDAYRAEQSRLTRALDQHVQNLSVRNQRVVGYRVLFELGIFVAILLLAMRQHRALHAAIVTPVRGLLCDIRRIRDGELVASSDRAAPRELAELAQGLNEVVRALSEAQACAVSRDEALSQHSRRLRQILDASREFSESLNLQYVVGSVRASTSAIGGYQQVIVWLMDDEHKQLTESLPSEGVANLPAAPGPGSVLADRAARSGRVTFEGPSGMVRFADHNMDAVRATAIPLIVGARVVGVLEARHDEARVATNEVIEILEMLATHAATAIESARLHEVIEERSQVDPLTRLLNRRRLEEDLAAECKRCERYGRPLAFVMLDIDHFKAFNDAHGHPKADTALQAVAEIIASSVRTTDTAYRYGGEEFCILLRETSAEDAMHFAERIRQRIEQRFESGEVSGITASFGVSDFCSDKPSPGALIEEADAAMYDSKHAGRNRVSSSHMLAARDVTKEIDSAAS